MLQQKLWGNCTKRISLGKRTDCQLILGGNNFSAELSNLWVSNLQICRFYNLIKLHVVFVKVKCLLSIIN